MMERNLSLDILKLSMAFMVVAAHARFLSELSPLGEYLTVNGLFRIILPVFLIINGFYFFPVLVREAHISWFKKILFLYVIWMCFYIYFWFSLPDLSLVSLTKLSMEMIFGYWHLWYISGMLVAASLLLIINKLFPSFLVPTILVFSVLGLIIQYAGNYNYFEDPFWERLFDTYWLHRNGVLYSYPFFCIGYLINKHKIHNSISIRTAGIMSAIGFIFLLSESYFNYYQEGREGEFDFYLSLFFLAPFVFIFFSKLEMRGNSKNIALYSSAIYFIHVFCLIVLRKYTTFGPLALTFACLLMSIIASYFIIKIHKKVKCIL